MDRFENDPSRNDELIVVDAFDRQTGVVTKERAHLDGLLHRAFSVVLMRDGVDGPELLVSRRALCKYHSGGLWTNSCCSHPRDGEPIAEAAVRRVREELDVEAFDLRKVCTFVYRAAFDNGIIEYEYDHVFVARCTGAFDLDSNEVSDVRWVTTSALAAELVAAPETFAVWSLTVFPRVFAYLGLQA